MSTKCNQSLIILLHVTHIMKIQLKRHLLEQKFSPDIYEGDLLEIFNLSK
jgi:hypothetical protein